MNDLAHDYVTARRRMAQKARFAKRIEDEGLSDFVNSDYMFDNDVIGVPEPDADDELANNASWQQDSRIRP
jgi:hypothetical protein